jgi:hypothetical protein
MNKALKESKAVKIYNDGIPIYSDNTYVMFQDLSSLNEVLIKKTTIAGEVLTTKFFYQFCATSAIIDTLWVARAAKTYDNLLNL